MRILIKNDKMLNFEEEINKVIERTVHIMSDNGPKTNLEKTKLNLCRKEEIHCD